MRLWPRMLETMETSAPCQREQNPGHSIISACSGAVFLAALLLVLLLPHPCPLPVAIPPSHLHAQYRQLLTIGGLHPPILHNLCTVHQSVQGARGHAGHRHLPGKGAGRAGGCVGGARCVCPRGPRRAADVVAQRRRHSAAWADHWRGSWQRQVGWARSAACCERWMSLRVLRVASEPMHLVRAARGARTIQCPMACPPHPPAAGPS